MTRDRLGTMWAGLALIALGIAFLIAQWVGWENVWPIFPLLGGLAFLGGYVASGFRESGFVFVGVGALLIGIFFFGFTVGPWEWAQMEQLWPVFPLIGGLAFGALFLAERGRDWGTLGVGCAAIVVGIVGLGFTYGLVAGDVVKFWPVLLIFIGLFSLVGGLLRMGRNRQE